MTGRYQTKPTLFREATSDDEAALTLIAERTIAICYRRFLNAAKVDALLEGGAINEYLVDNLEENYSPILLLGQLPVGFAVCQHNTIGLILIDYRYQGGGLGTKLLAHCEAEMFQAYPAIALQCFEQDEQANQFFLKNGWLATLTRRDKQIGARTTLYQKLWSDTKKP